MSLIITVILVAIAAFVFIGVLLALMIQFTKAKLVGSSDVKLIINEDESHTLEAQSGSTLLNSLLSHDIAIPSPCGGKATCKQCKVLVSEGAGPVLEPDKATFNHKELQEGWRLSCQCKVKNDLHLKIPESLLSVQEFEATVISNNNVATFIKELIVQVPESVPIDYRSGSYLQFHVPSYTTNTSDWKKTMDPKYYSDWEKFGLFDKSISYVEGKEHIARAYSMASYPAEGKVLKFNIRIATPPIAKQKVINKPWGICSTYTFSLKEGDKIKLSGPYGESFMKNDDRELVFLIGGAGSSFGRSHILHLLNTEKTNRKVTLWYGARSLKENIYQNEYEELAKNHDNFDYHLVLSEPLEEDLKAGWPTKEQDPVRTNYLFLAFEQGQLKNMKEPEECLFYVCGPPLHNQSVMKLLYDYGVEKQNIVLDDFGN